MKRLRQVRESKGVTKAALVRHLGISKPTYDEYEQHPERMRIETAKKVADFLSVDIPVFSTLDVIKINLQKGAQHIAEKRIGDR